MNYRDSVKSCCICGRHFRGYGNNPYPFVKDAGKVCCNDCNAMKVVPARLAELAGARI